MSFDPKNWGVVIAAGGGRDLHFPEFEHKSLIEFVGKPCILWMVDTCLNAGFGSVVVAASEPVKRIVQEIPNVLLAESGNNNIQTVSNGVLKCEPNSLIFLPSDSPLLHPEHLLQFAKESSKKNTGDVWFSAGLANRKEVENFAPNAKFKYLRLGNEKFASGACFAASKTGFEIARSRIESFASNRKSQFKMLMQVGIGTLIRYALGRLDLHSAEMGATRFLGGPSFIVPNVHPATTFDFDTQSELEYIRANWDRLTTPWS